MQKVEIVFPPRRVSQFFNKTYQPDKHSNASATYDNYCDTEQTTEVPSSYDNSIHTMKTKVEPLETTDDTIMNSDETKNTNLGQNLLDTPDTLVNSTNTLKFTSKCPENRSNNIIPLKMKRIIKKPKIILRTSRFGRTQLLNAAKSIPAIESIPVAVDTAIRLDDAIEIHDTSEGNVSKVEILSECSKHTDILQKEQGSELVFNSEIEEIPVMTIDDEAESNILVPQQNTFDEEFRGFEFDEKDSEADVQIKHLEKVLQTLNNFQDNPDTTQEFIDPQCDVTQEFIGPQSQVTQEWIDPNSLIPTQEYIESQIQTKVLHRFELKKDDIEKLDETLKEVSFNLNSCAVSEDLELENKKLKLVVKHLMNKLQVSSLQETFDFDEEIVNLTENVDMEPLVTEEAIDATLQEGLLNSFN